MATAAINIAHFQRRAPQGGPAWLQRMRKVALERFVTLGFPTTHQEEWRFTSVAPIAETELEDAPYPNPRGARLDALRQRARGGWPANRLVFVDGYVVRALSVLVTKVPGLVLEGIAEVLDKTPDVLRPHLARLELFQDRPFSALNTAYLRDGAVLKLPPGRVIDEPIHLLFLSSGARDALASQPRVLILAQPGSQATVVETYAGLEPVVSFTNAVTELALEDGAIVDHTLVLEEPDEAFHVGTLAVQQARGSSFRSQVLSLGGGLVRRDVHVTLDGEGAECQLDGLYLCRGRQHHDHHTTIVHARPQCRSAELYKGILDGASHAVFNGRILVRIDAQKSDARQVNKNLLLSDDCAVDTQPQLEIYADDVKCAHGATVGQLDPEALFYLRTRGIDAATARGMLSFAFAREVLERFPVKPLREELEAQVRARIGGVEETP